MCLGVFCHQTASKEDTSGFQRGLQQGEERGSTGPPYPHPCVTTAGFASAQRQTARYTFRLSRGRRRSVSL
ncbi:hypothetical protein EYF80_021562 [Liparis tanakae]|uniref:Uncharacterized protein n=1 Tax=Liparis tanakae TaxID=230148 RepID=A0A4Z2HRJ8_9TELE|nr:hypothetical protein EYF80_021562 [Liparis tanakae]